MGRGRIFDRTHDARVRAAVFEWLADRVLRYGDVLSREDLSSGVQIEGIRVPLLGPQGIFKPAIMAAPLSITTVPGGGYDDGFGPDGVLSYRYRGTDPDHPDNVGLRLAWHERLPLIYLHRLVPGKYVAAWPVFIVADRLAQLAFDVQVDDAVHAGLGRDSDTVDSDEAEAARRRYITTTVRVRLHQRVFRERVLSAYRSACALCHFRHRELLDAAHITADADPLGEPVVSNGIALCRLHHGAFDNHFLAVRPDLRIEIRRDILEERDGPTLRYALQQLHEASVHVPRDKALRPSEERLVARYERFLIEARKVS